MKNVTVTDCLESVMANLTLDPFVQGELVKILQIYEVGTAQCTPTVGVEDVFEPWASKESTITRTCVSVVIDNTKSMSAESTITLTLCQWSQRLH